MDLALDESQLLLQESFADFFAKECPPARVRDAEPLGFCPELWGHLSQLGAPGVGVSETAGGSGGSLLDMLLIAEEVGAAAAPVPFAEVTVASRLLAAVSADASPLPKTLTGEAIPSLALEDVARQPRQLVPAGAVASHVLALHGDELRMLSLDPDRSADSPSNLGSAPVAWVDFSGGASQTTLARGDEALAQFQRARDEWFVVTAASLVGLARRSLELGVAYAKERIQFGVPIGSFQAIAHRLADEATATDGARLLVWEAAWAEGVLPERFAELCAMAFTWAAQTARSVSETSLHVHGGYGFSLEYDIQLYYRRACAWSLVAGGPRRGLEMVAERRFGSAAA